MEVEFSGKIRFLFQKTLFKNSWTEVHVQRISVFHFQRKWNYKSLFGESSCFEFNQENKCCLKFDFYPYNLRLIILLKHVYTIKTPTVWLIINNRSEIALKLLFKFVKEDLEEEKARPKANQSKQQIYLE